MVVFLTTRLEHLQFATLCTSNHTARGAAASRFIFGKGKILYFPRCRAMKQSNS